MTDSRRTIMTYTGKMVDPFDLQKEDVDILDITQALSLICRFTGHVNRFYSVAEHSIHVFNWVKDRSKSLNDKELSTRLLTALLHDAGEAYFNDLAAPVKHSDDLKNYAIAENIAGNLILDWLGGFNRTDQDLDLIKQADYAIYCVESNLLQHHLSPSVDPDILYHTHPDYYNPYNFIGNPKEVKVRFLEIYNFYKEQLDKYK